MRFPPRFLFRTKIMLGVAAMIVLLGLVLALLAGRIASRSLLEESGKRGESLAVSLAARLVDPLLAQDFLRLRNRVNEAASADEDVLYAFVLDDVGQVLAHSFRGGFPIQLREVNQVEDREQAAVLLLDTNEGMIYDFAAPVVVDQDRIGTVRVGLSRDAVMASVNRLTGTIFAMSGAMLVLALALSGLFAHTVTRRIKKLKDSADRMIRGDLDVQTSVTLNRNCWEIMDCDLERCPAHGDSRRRCWYLAGTLCSSCEQGGYAQKIETCRVCQVYKQTSGDEIQDLAESFDVMAVTLKNHIGELQEAESVLTRQKQLLRTILDATPDLVSLKDENLAYQAVNRVFLSFHNVSESQVLGRTDFDLFDTEIAEAERVEDKEVLDAGRPLNRERKVARKSGSLWLHQVKLPVEYREGGRAGLLATSRDITELKRYQAQLIQSQKMEEVGKLAGGIAHEINTPLGVILGYAQLLQEDVEKDSQLYKDLETIEKQAKVSKKIVADLLGFSRQMESDMNPLDLNKTLVEVSALVEHSFGLDHVDVELILDPDIPAIVGDPEKLKQVWMNLLSNAKHAVQENGLIRVFTRLSESGDRVVVAVADTGTGMDDEQMARIFSPFYTTKPVGEGTGLGLSVSYGIINDHGGTVTVASPTPPEYICFDIPGGKKRGPGAVFKVELPVRPMEDEGAGKANAEGGGDVS